VSYNGHQVLGILVIGVLFFQPLSGWLAHHLFVQQKHKTWVHYIHRWTGRVFLVAGGINGGLGLQLAEAPKSSSVAYSVVAGVFFSAWFGLVLFDLFRPKQQQSQPDLAREEVKFYDEHRGSATSDDSTLKGLPIKSV